MKLTIQNTDKIIGYKIETPTAYWKVEYIEPRMNDYKIGVKFSHGKIPNMKHPKHVLFTLLRYNGYDSIGWGWTMINNWKPGSIALTKVLLSDLKYFTGILGGVLDNS